MAVSKLHRYRPGSHQDLYCCRDLGFPVLLSFCSAIEFHCPESTSIHQGWVLIMSPSRDSQQFLDEEHLLTEEEKDSVSAPVAISRRQPRSKLLTWSVVLNLVLAALLVASWSLSAWRSKKYWIPNEIYCKYCRYVPKHYQKADQKTK